MFNQLGLINELVIMCYIYNTLNCATAIKVHLVIMLYHFLTLLTPAVSSYKHNLALPPTGWRGNLTIKEIQQSSNI